MLASNGEWINFFFFFVFSDHDYYRVVTPLTRTAFSFPQTRQEKAFTLGHLFFSPVFRKPSRGLRRCAAHDFLDLRCRRLGGVRERSFPFFFSFEARNDGGWTSRTSPHVFITARLVFFQRVSFV